MASWLFGRLAQDGFRTQSVEPACPARPPHRRSALVSIAAAVAALHPNELEGAVTSGRLLTRRREQGALVGRLAATLLRNLEPALHGLGALEQGLYLGELPGRERAH